MNTPRWMATPMQWILVLFTLNVLPNALWAQPVTGHHPGYVFEPGSVATLAGFHVDRDRISVSAATTSGVRRTVMFDDGVNRLIITIGVIQNRDFNSSKLLVDLGSTLSEFRFKDVYFDAATIGLSIGDHTFVRTGSTVTDAYGGLLFSRNNIFVYVREKGPFSTVRPPRVNLIPIAQEIDSQIQLNPALPFQNFKTYLPVIERFEAHRIDLRESEEAWITLNARDPRGRILKHIYQADDGDVIQTGSPIRYIAGSDVGPQILSIISVNPALLFATDSIRFNVTP